MTKSIIPYSFKPGTKAKANEVNANFIAVADKIEQNETSTTKKFERIEDKLETSVREIEEQSEQKAELNLENVDEAIDFVTETWRSENGRSWYRKYRSGFVEQGGYISGSSTITINLFCPAAAATSTALISRTMSSGSASGNIGHVREVTDTQLKILAYSSGDQYYWTLCGQSL